MESQSTYMDKMDVPMVLLLTREWQVRRTQLPSVL